MDQPNKEFNNELTKTNFFKEFQGYHLINQEPVKEAVWESFLPKILKEYKINYEAKGSHKSGIDTTIADINYSCKTSKTKKGQDTLKISSYRLTSICNNRDHGVPAKIIENINEKDASFDYYMLLVREDVDKEHILYSWYVLPKILFEQTQSEFELSYDKGGKVSGWKTSNASITFSMSSQLWFTLKKSEIEGYKVVSTKIKIKPYVTYSDIYEKFKVE